MIVEKKKLMRLTTVDLSLDKFLCGQLRFMNQYFDVVGVAADTGLLQKVAEREGIRVIDVPMHREISLGSDIKSIIVLYKLFKKEKPYILHCNTPKGSLLSLAAGWAARVPNRVYLVTGLRYQGVHGVFRLLLKTIERLSCLFATKVIPEGQGVLHTLKEDRITKKPLQVLHYGNINGIDTEYFSREYYFSTTDRPEKTRDDLRHAFGFSDNDFVFVFVGRMVKDKGINELAQSMKKLIVDCADKNPKLLVVGSFDETDPVNQESKDFLQNSKSVKCVGWKDDVRPYLAVADAMVFPSYREGFPNTPIQAGAFDLPCIVTDINGANEIIKDNINGTIIVNPLAKDTTKFSSSMEGALYHTMKFYLEHPEEVERMGKNARGLITSRYEQKDVWQAILNMYKSL